MREKEVERGGRGRKDRGRRKRREGGRRRRNLLGALITCLYSAKSR